MEYTKEQLSAINSKNCDLLVAAAAGSGKTAVLVERIIQIITDADKSVDIDRLLVVTFTEAAASEMRQRISKALTDKVSENPEDDHLKRQLFILNRAQIMTIHSFCLSLAKQNFHLLDVDPGFRIADETESLLIKTETLNELFEKLYETGNAEFLQLVECYGGRVKDENLQKLVLQIYNFVSSCPNPARWIRDFSEEFKLAKGLNKSIWSNLLIKDIKLKLAGILDELDRLIDKTYEWDIPPEISDMLNGDYNIAKKLAACESFEEMYAKFSGVYKTYITFPRKKFNADYKEYIQRFRTKKFKDVISGINKNAFFKEPEQMAKEIQSMYPLMKALGRIVLDFSERYRLEKKEKCIADFNDLEHFALEILMDTDTYEPTETASVLRLKYEEILIDEYQDSATRCVMKSYAA